MNTKLYNELVDLVSMRTRYADQAIEFANKIEPFIDANFVPKSETIVEPKHCINCKHLTHEIDDGYPFDWCHYFDIVIVDMTKHFCEKIEVKPV